MECVKIRGKHALKGPALLLIVNDEMIEFKYHWHISDPMAFLHPQTCFVLITVIICILQTLLVYVSK